MIPIMVTIKKASALTGVSEHTLRAWERRYGLVTPSRTPSGYRTYDEGELDRIRLMHRLVEAGWAAGAAAAEVDRHIGPGLAEDPYSALIRAAGDLDGAAVGRVVDDRFAGTDFETLVDGWLMPALYHVGLAWESGAISVAGEHLVANVVTRRLAASYEAVGDGQAGPAVVIGAPPGVDHQLGLMAFATAARRVGLATLYLGAQVPLDAWRDAARRSSAWAAVTSVHRGRDAVRAAKVVTHLAEDPGIPVWAGGRFQDRLDGARPLGHSIGAAARELAAARDSHRRPPCSVMAEEPSDG